MRRPGRGERSGVVWQEGRAELLGADRPLHHPAVDLVDHEVVRGCEAGDDRLAQARTDQSLIEEVERGLYVTGLIGLGVNLVTGDFSQGRRGAVDRERAGSAFRAGTRGGTRAQPPSPGQREHGYRYDSHPDRKHRKRGHGFGTIEPDHHHDPRAHGQGGKSQIDRQPAGDLSPPVRPLPGEHP
jgi:hypothetical protein